MSRWKLGVLAFMLLLCACAPRDAKLAGDTAGANEVLLAAARRPLAAWRTRGGRQADLEDAADSMVEALRELGHPQAAVAVAVRDGVACFTVEAGLRLVLGNVTFTGVDAANAAVLRACLPQPSLGRTRPPFVRRHIEDATGTMRRRLRRRGYLEATIATPEPEWDGTSSAVSLVIAVDPGPRFRLRSVAIAGPTEVDPAIARALHAMAPSGEPYHELLPREVAAKLTSHLSRHGYLAAQATATAIIDRDAAAVDLTVTVIPGPRHRLTGFTITGQRRTREGFIRRAFRPMVSGEIANQQRIDAGIRKLYRSGLFARAYATTELDGPPDADGTQPVRLHIDVAESADRKLDLSLGWGSYELLRGGITWTDENVFGEGLRASTGVRASFKGWGVKASLLDRFHLGNGRSLGTDISHNVREEPSFIRRESEWITTLRHEFEPPFDPQARWDIRTSYAISFNEDEQVSAPIAGAEDDTYRLTTIGLRLRRDDRKPNAIDPDHGGAITTGLAWSLPDLGSDIAFTEYHLGLDRHFRVLPGLVVAARAEATTREPKSYSDTLPIGERLFLGGEDSVRSFTQDDLGPHDAEGDAIGGLSRALATLELRCRLFPSWPRLELAGFCDAGRLGQEAWTLDRPTGWAIGAGARYVLPVGPIRFDYAYNPGDDFGADHRWAVHLTVGFSF